MGATKIEWAQAVWNPVTGCTPVSEGCKNCYARRMANRLRGRCGYDKDDPFRVTIHMDRMNEPARWRKPRLIFVCSMGDLFHNDVPTADIARILSICALCREHTFLLLTKRPQRAKEIVVQFALPNNVWPGASIENQKTADERIPILMQIPAAVRFVSCEPLLGPICLDDADCEWWQSDGIDWVIAGGETGPGARPMHPDWARSLRDQCQAVGVPFFFKQWGEWVPASDVDLLNTMVVTSIDDPRYHAIPTGGGMIRVGKKAAGRELDGRTWDQMPKGR